MPIIFLFPPILHSVNVPVYQDYLYSLISSFHPRQKCWSMENRKEEKRRPNKEREREKKKMKEFQQVIGTKTKEPSLDSN